MQLIEEKKDSNRFKIYIALREMEGRIKMKLNKRNSKGITLIALIVTIIGILILASVSINILFGENGIIEKTKRARGEYNNSQIAEQQDLEEVEKQLAEYENTLPENTAQNPQNAGTQVKMPSSWYTTIPAYISTEDGVIVINLENYSSNIRSYRIQMKSIQVDDELIRVRRGEDIYINSGAHVLEMFPEIVNYSVNVPYVSIYLEGYDSEPRVMLQSELNNIVYRNIPVGTYKFHLAVLDDKGKVTVTENIYTIIKKAEMYDNWWFKIYMVAVFAIIVAYITWIIFHTQVKRTLDFQKKELEFVKKQLEMGNETVMTIARTVDAKDINTSQHSLRVSEYSVLIAKALGYNEDECENLKKAALLHDIGKIGIPDRILNKPDRLTDEEYALMKSHVEKGAQILKNFTLINHVEEGALYHHERYDGSGYMYGLKGEEIPLNARIIGIADAFDAMTANRVYRKKLDKDYVIREIKRGSGTQFDPKLVEIMLGLIEKGLIDIDNLYKDGENHVEQ